MTDPKGNVLKTAVDLAAEEGIAPETEHFLTAAITNGDEEDRRLAQLDLQAIEEGRSTDSFVAEPVDWGDDPYWCYDCNRDTAFCKCICHECCELIDNCVCKN